MYIYIYIVKVGPQDQADKIKAISDRPSDHRILPRPSDLSSVTHRNATEPNPMSRLQQGQTTTYVYIHIYIRICIHVYMYAHTHISKGDRTVTRLFSSDGPMPQI